MALTCFACLNLQQYKYTYSYTYRILALVTESITFYPIAYFQ